MTSLILTSNLKKHKLNITTIRLQNIEKSHVKNNRQYLLLVSFLLFYIMNLALCKHLEISVSHLDYVELFYIFNHLITFSFLSCL